MSRPMRLAAVVGGRREGDVERGFLESRVLIRLEPRFAVQPDARETFELAVNQVLRFCPNVTVSGADDDMVAACRRLAQEIHGGAAELRHHDSPKWIGFDAVLNVGVEVPPGLPWTTVNSTGWVARVQSAASEPAKPLYWRAGTSNCLGALTAACLGSGRVFWALLGLPWAGTPIEMSLFTGEVGSPGTLAAGPALPGRPLDIDAFLVGCGGVSNGWAYAVRRLPIVGRLQAVDRQAVRPENLGAYVLAGRSDVKRPKVEVVSAYLSPKIGVTPRGEELEFFKIRLRYGLRMPPLVVNGLDNVEARHSVQRLWPPTIIDMAAGGPTAQVIVKTSTDDGICLLTALTRAEVEGDHAEQLAADTGLRSERIRNNATDTVTEEDIAAAPSEKREALDAARRNGDMLCGFITRRNLEHEEASPDFAAAAPFVTSLSGIVAAAETVKYLMTGATNSLHMQFDFRSNRSTILRLQCDPACECANRT